MQTAQDIYSPQIDPETAIITDPPVRSLWWHSWRRLRRNRLAMVGLVVVVLMTLVAIFASLIAPMDPNRQIPEYGLKEEGFTGSLIAVRAQGSGYEDELIPVQSYSLQGDVLHYVSFTGENKQVPRARLSGETEAEWHRTPTYLLGADQLGRDVLSRLVFGARTSITIGLIAELLSLTIGITLGALAGYFRGWVDGVVMYAANVIWSFPFILLVIALSLVWEGAWNEYIVPNFSFLEGSNIGFWQAFISIGIASWVDTARIVRGQFFSLRETEYVEATRALGFGSMRTVFRHMLPNTLGPITVVATAGFASAIIAEASLSYLGIGVSVPMASWGQMINDGYGYLMAGTNLGLAIYPSVAIALAVFGFNLLGDGLRDAFDPKMTK